MIGLTPSPSYLSSRLHRVHDMTAHLPALIEKCYEDFDVIATESELVPSLLQNREQNQNISREI